MLLHEEQDLRGMVPGKGWAHCLAHTADTLLVLVRSRYLSKANLSLILIELAHKLTAPAAAVWVYNEDERLARVVIRLCCAKNWI